MQANVPSIPMTPLIDDKYTRTVTRTTNGGRQDYVDYVLPISVDPSKCIAIINQKIGHYYSDSGNKFGLGFLAEIPDKDTLRLWVGGSAYHTVTNYVFVDIPIAIYELGRKPKRIETVRSTANAINESVMLSAPINLAKAVIVDGAIGGTNYAGQSYFEDENSVHFQYCLGCIVLEF